MGTRKTNGALEGHVDVKDAYRMAQDDVRTLLGSLPRRRGCMAEYAKKAGCTRPRRRPGEPCAGPWSRLAQLAQQDEEFVWKRLAEARETRK